MTTYRSPNQYEIGLENWRLIAEPSKPLNKGARLTRHSTLDETLFAHGAVPNRTTITAQEYRDLRKAAKSKNKLPQLTAWLRDRKITIKD